MLILTRRSGECILIGDDIEILVKEVGKNHVRIGINAPKDVTIRRKETTDRVVMLPEVREPSSPPNA